VVLAASVIGVLLVNIVLVWSNHTLRSRLDAILADKTYAVGDAYPAFAGVDLEGRRVYFDPAASRRRSLMFLMSVGCPACLASLDQWRSLAGRLDADEWDVLWLSRDPWDATREFARGHEMRGVVLAEFPCRTSRHLSLGFVPKVVVLDPGGKVRRVVSGRQDDDTWAEVERFVLASSHGGSGATVSTN
jgi:peroxiredoxin